MTALLSSFAVVARAEMGDKTQLIALILGLRYRRPWTVMGGCSHRDGFQSRAGLGAAALAMT